MQKASIELRGWEFSGNYCQAIAVAGLIWIPEEDIPTIDGKTLQVDLEQSVITKIFIPSLGQSKRKEQL